MKLDVFYQKCKDHGVKVTTQRLAIYKVVSRSLEHPSADKIFKKVGKSFPGLSFDTVNRTLLTFSDIGLIRLVEGCGDDRRFDPDLDLHHHLRCIKCHKIVDFYHSDYDKIAIPKNIQNGFTVISKKVVLEGICQKCFK